VPPFRFVQWDGKLIREISAPSPQSRVSSRSPFLQDGLRRHGDRVLGAVRSPAEAGVIPANVKFQISLPTPIAPIYNNMVPADRPACCPL
jgi:hypothetical protein